MDTRGADGPTPAGTARRGRYPSQPTINSAAHTARRVRLAHETLSPRQAAQASKIHISSYRRGGLPTRGTSPARLLRAGWRFEYFTFRLTV